MNKSIIVQLQRHTNIIWNKQDYSDIEQQRRELIISFELLLSRFILLLS